MDKVSRPLIALLLGTVAFFALWLIALKPGSSNSSSQGGLGSYQSAIDKAHHAVALSNAVSAAQGGAAGPTVTSPAASPAVAPAAAASTSADPTVGTQANPTTAPIARTQVHTRPRVAVRHVSTTATRIDAVARALASKKVLALLFYNPAGPDDRAVKQELRGIPLHTGHVVELAVPLSELARYPVVTSQVSVVVSPTLVLIDRNHQATTIVGFADTFEISQRITDALHAG